MPSPLAMVMTATSRWATWESSCESTASTSGSSSRRSSPDGHADDGRLGAAARGEGIGDVGGGDGHLGLGHVGQGAQAVDHTVQLGSLLGRHLLGVHGVHGDLGAEPVLAEEQREGDDQHEGEREADGDQDADHQPVEQDEQEARQEHPVGQPPVRWNVA